MRVLVVGPARSGTSWVTATLGTTPGAAFLLEPDNPGQYPYAAIAAFGMGAWPVVAPDEPGPPRLRRLWDIAFGAPIRYIPGQQRVAVWLHRNSTREERQDAMRIEDPKMSLRLRVAAALAVPRNLPCDTRHRIVKSIRAQHMVEWIVANWEPTVVVCRRHPLDVVASRMEMTDQPRAVSVAPELRDEARRRYGIEIPPSNSEVAVQAWRVGMQMSVLHDVLRANPQFHTVDHEALCADPIGHFRALTSALGLDWSSENEAVVMASNRPGTGYELNRVQADLPGAWRRRLSPEDARTAAVVITQLPIAERYDLDVSRAS